MESGKVFSGQVIDIDGIPADYHAQIKFNQHQQTIIEVYGIEKKDEQIIEGSDYCCLIIRLTDGRYLSVFDVFLDSVSYIGGLEDQTAEKTVLTTTNAILGEKEFRRDCSFNCITFEVTSGHELIGLCPYDINPNYMDIVRLQDIRIPINESVIVADTLRGKIVATVYPKTRFSQNQFSCGFSHLLQFEPINRVTVKELHDKLEIFIEFFEVLSGEAVTINRLHLWDSSEEKNSGEFIGYCNYPIESLRMIEGNGFDATGYSRASLFKLSDFIDIRTTFEKWLTLRDKLSIAEKAYERILLDETMGIVTINKYLAAMQLIEGYIFAVQDDSRARQEFKEKKSSVLSKVEDEEDKAFIEKYLTYMGQHFSESVKEFLKEGIHHFEIISNSQFSKRYYNLVGSIVKDRDLYTHSIRDRSPQMTFLKTVRIASICKDLYRANILSTLGLSDELIRHRFSHDRSFVAYMDQILSVDVRGERKLEAFDKQMWHFSEMPSKTDD